MKIRKPKVWEWIIYGGVALTSLFREELIFISGYLPPFLAFVVERIAKTRGIGIALLIGCVILRISYANLSPEEQREADRRDTDERNVAIRGKAAWFCMNMILIMLAISGLLFAYWDSLREALVCAILVYVGVFSLPLLEHWYNKRM